MGGREDYVTCLRKKVLSWMGDREDYVMCLRKEGVVLYVRQRGLCYLFMGGREDFVSSLRK